MATNKHATIRYHALDKCFSNFGKRFFIDDLIKACNEALYEYTAIEDGVKRRQVFDDIRFMESDQSWAIPLERLNEGKKVFYRYADKKYSIRNPAISEAEAKQLKETLSILTRFKGMPQFAWMEEMLARIETSLLPKERTQTIVGFEQNPFLKGMEHFDALFNAIQNKIVLEVSYQGFKYDTPQKHLIHPYFLKQYNSRWFLFGFNPEYDSLSNFPLDRIAELKETNALYIENTSVDFETYFEDVVGVSLPKDAIAESIILEVETHYWPYLATKPIHGSQTIKVKTDTCVTIQLELIVNYELIALLFSMGENIRILSPDTLRETIKQKAEKLFLRYV